MVYRENKYQVSERALSQYYITIIKALVFLFLSYFLSPLYGILSFIFSSNLPSTVSLRSQAKFHLFSMTS
ncbi:hypothetical protein P3S68_028954 [Capsicum galapagoense]